jgi:glycosyltransferase involved in cell wall biosynthesis
VNPTTQHRKINVMALGLRGIPNVPGGVEVHASELYPRLQGLGANVIVMGRTPYRPADAPAQWRGVSVRWLPCPRLQGVEALAHTFFGVLYAAVRRPDVLHVHAVGPWLMVPLAKLLGLRVLVTHHGQDYLREKWNAPARVVLRLGERLGMRFADGRIVISQGLLELARVRYQREATLIPNGIAEPAPHQSRLVVDRYGLTPQRYIIQVSRLVPEKRQLDLITAFKAARLQGWKLLLVGGAQGSQRYADLVRQKIAGDDTILNTGFLSSAEVQELLVHAGIFALPSSHEGLPIALLEAMKLGTPVVASDIPPNREMQLDDNSYFRVGDTAKLCQRLREFAALSPVERSRLAKRLNGLCARYDWDKIAESTMEVMERVAALPPDPVPSYRTSVERRARVRPTPIPPARPQ